MIKRHFYGSIRGMSLVEVIIALSLVGLIVLFLLGLLPSSGFVVHRAEQQLAASSYAEEIVARLASMPFNELKGAAGTLTPQSPGLLLNSLERRELGDGTILNPEVVIELVAPVNRLVQARVKIKWRTNNKDLEFSMLRRFSAVLR